MGVLLARGGPRLAKVAAMFVRQLAKETWQAGIVLTRVLTEEREEALAIHR